VLVGAGGAAIARAEAALAVDRPRPGWSEQDPDAWWGAARAVLAALRAEAPVAFGGVRGIGLSGQMHAAVVLDAADRPLRPAILWDDARATAECATLAERVPGLGRLAGVPAMAGFTAPKLLWLAAHQPEVWRRARRIVLAKDLVRLALTGAHATDPCDASGTLLLDQQRRAWSAPLLAAAAVAPELLPAVVEGPAVTGTVRPGLAAELGLPPGVVVVAGAGDAAAAARGVGAIGDGDALVQLGTAAQLLVTTDSYRPFPETLVHAFAHGLPGRWFQMAAMLNGGSCLAWAARLLGEPDPARLLARVEAAHRGPGRLVFLPYLAGERTPHDDPHARGVLLGLDSGTTAEALVQAVLEGVAYAFVDAADCLARAGTTLGPLAVVGGGARSRLWLEILAGALGRPITVHEAGATGPALGAARLARIAVTGEPTAVVCTAPPVVAVVEPVAAHGPAYRAGHARFARLYRALREEFRAAAC
jgi:xylulokinase